MPNPSDADLAEILKRPGYRISGSVAPQNPDSHTSKGDASRRAEQPVALKAKGSGGEPTTRKIAQAMSEADLQASVIELAHFYGWRVAHFRSVKVTKKDGSTYWQTPVAADGEGWPDLIMARDARGEGAGRVLVIECKTEKGKVEPAQTAWLSLLRLTQRVEVFVWRPTAWLTGEIDALLR